MQYRNITYARTSASAPAREDAFVTITLSRPERRNCLSSETMSELADAFGTASVDSDVAGIILASTGTVFSSGHDLSEMAEMDEPQLKALFDQCTSLMAGMAEVPQVVVAQVQGLATAAGAQLAASADLIVASEEAGFAAPGGKGGLFCHTPMVALARPLGQKRAMEMALTGETINAETALEWGLVNRVVPADQLTSATLELLTSATRGSRYSKGIGKQTLYAQMNLATSDAYDLAVGVMAESAARGDGAEWPKAFIEKRRPEWTHTG